ncbi:MAG: hypothetical protein HYU78_14075 [Rhodocyclales bacterium]|nr:hypothetical protein [Rhodocyclales bacterium]
MVIQYKIDAIDMDALQLRITCFNDEFSEGIRFALDIPRFHDDYPEGIEVDRFIETRLPREAFAQALGAHRKKQSARPENPPARARDSAGFVNTLAAMTHVTDGNEKIFLLRPLSRIRRFQIPVESY